MYMYIYTQRRKRARSHNFTVAQKCDNECLLEIIDSIIDCHVSTSERRARVARNCSARAAALRKRLGSPRVRHVTTNTCIGIIDTIKSTIFPRQPVPVSDRSDLSIRHRSFPRIISPLSAAIKAITAAMLAQYTIEYKIKCRLYTIAPFLLQGRISFPCDGK